ncbi:MAG: hypothetical protein V1777_03200 [Candidatus Micrarchaeota archaeon]
MHKGEKSFKNNALKIKEEPFMENEKILLHDLKIFLQEIHNQKLTPKTGLIPRKKCVEINEKLLKKDNPTFDPAVWGEEAFFRISLLRGLSEANGLARTTPQKMRLAVKNNKEFFSNNEKEQLNRLFFSFFAKLNWQNLGLQPPRFAETLQNQSLTIAKFLLENSEKEINSKEMIRQIFFIAPQDEKPAVWELDFLTSIFETAILAALECFDAVTFQKTKAKRLQKIKITPQGKELLEQFFHPNPDSIHYSIAE